MSPPKRLRVADLGAEVDDLANSQNQRLFKKAELNWCTPRLWQKGAGVPINGEDGPCLYAIVRNNGKSRNKDIIEYIGLTKDPKKRFTKRNHKIAWEIAGRRGTTHISLAPIDFVRGRNRIENEKKASEEIEHILIWAVEPRENIKKSYTLPGMGKNRSNAWHIRNVGYRFAGQLPLEIVFPWMLIRAGRNRARKIPK